MMFKNKVYYLLTQRCFLEIKPYPYPYPKNMDAVTDQDTDTDKLFQQKLLFKMLES